MRHLPQSIRRVIEELSKLPGIGPKTAGRLAFFLVRQSPSQSQALGGAVSQLHEALRTCSRCFNITEADPCPICADPSRDDATICVVEQPLDTVAFERTEYAGRYHVLGGALSPIDGIGPEQLRVKELLQRLGKESLVRELIIATNPSLEGEATALYLEQAIGESVDAARRKTLTITRIARGLPIGGDVEYADAVTLARALEGRRAYSA